MTISDVCLLGTLIVSVIALCYQVFGNKSNFVSSYIYVHLNKKETTARTSTLRRLVSNQQVENPLIAGISFSIIILYQINKNVKHRFDT